MHDYSFNEHRHRFALWTAARAVQRSFTTTERIANAIETTTLRQFAETAAFITPAEYDKQQSEWCTIIMDCFKPLECSYGRAAKMVAIYLKTSVILPAKGVTPLCDAIHPPIDSILLKNLIKYEKLRELTGSTWTTLSSAEYWNIADIIRTSLGFFNWKLEAYWQPQQELELTK